MPDYPVKDGDGADIITNAYDPAWTPPSSGGITFSPVPAAVGLHDPRVAEFLDDTPWPALDGTTYSTAGRGTATIDGTQAATIIGTATLDTPMVAGEEYAAYAYVTEQSAGSVFLRGAGDGLTSQNLGTSSNAARHMMRYDVANENFTDYGFVATSTVEGVIENCQVFPLSEKLAGKLWIIVCAGQSQMVGASAETGFDDAVDFPEFRALAVAGRNSPSQGYTTDGTGATINANLSGSEGIGYPIPLTHPVCHSTQNLGGVSPVGEMAKMICDAGGVPDDVTVVFACMAAGGSDMFTVWNPDDDARYYDLMVANVEALLAKNPENEVVGFAWSQGESSTAVGYAALFNSIATGLRDMWGEFPIVILEQGQPDDEPSVVNMNAEQQKLATGSGDEYELPSCTFVPRPADWSLEADNVHFDGPTQRKRGRDAAFALIELMNA